MRALIKTVVSAATSRSGAARALSRWNGLATKPLVLGYHRVVRDFEREARYSIPSMLVTTRMLEEHLDWIGRRFRFATLEEISTRLQSGEPFERPTAAITFDDGYADVYQNAFPMMRRKGIPAAVFVVTDLVGSPKLQQYDALYLLIGRALSTWNEPNKEIAGIVSKAGAGALQPEIISEGGNAFRLTTLLLQVLRQAEVRQVIRTMQEILGVELDSFDGLRAADWNMLAEMQAAGFLIGSHTRTHALLTHEDPGCVAEELRGSRRSLQQALGGPATHLAYPDGKFNPTVLEAAVNAGYRFAYTICRHQDARHPLMTIRRRVLWEKSCVDSRGRFSPGVMECQIAGAFDLAAPCKGRHGTVPVSSPATSLPAYERIENR